jgi:hypothetical protein
VEGVFKNRVTATTFNETDSHNSYTVNMNTGPFVDNYSIPG